MVIKIRKPTRNDENIFIELCCGLTVYNRSHVWLYEDFSKLMEKRRLKAKHLFNNPQPNQLILLATLDSQPVGYITCYVYHGMRSNGYIDELYMHEEARGKGIGKMLVSEAMRWMQTEGAKRVTLNVFNWNQTALKFYEAFQFKPYATSYERDLG